MRSPALKLPLFTRGIDLKIAALIASTIVAYWPASSALWHFWMDHPFFSVHGMPVAALALWLLYRARSRIAAAPVRGLPWMLAPLLACSVASLLLPRAGLEWQLLLLPTLMLLAVAAAFGMAVTRAIAVPVGFLCFAMPVWDVLAVPLQTLTVAVVRWVAPLIGLPAEVSGTIVSLPGGNSFDVTVWCSGVGFLVQGLAVATLLGELEQASTGRRLRLFAAMLVTALLANWVRVLTIIQLGYATGMRNVLVTRGHVLLGYVWFGAVLIAYVWVATRRAPAGAPRKPSTDCTPHSATPGPYIAVLLALAAAPALAGVLALFR
jgi:exosortase